jgi:two-component system NarL family sensor kinase
LRVSLAPAELMRRIVAIAAEERSLRDVLKRSASLVVQATGADACFVHVVDHDRDQVVLMGAEPERFDALAGSIRLSLGEGVAGWVAERGEMAVVSDKWSDPRYRYIPELRGEDYRSLVSVPLLRPGRGVVGVVNVHARESGHFAPEVVERLAEVADLLAGIVEGAVLHERLRQREAQLEAFAERTIELQEIERHRIAGDIHDGISQRLVSAWYHLRAARTATGAPELASELSAVEGLISAALDEARGAIRGLRPTVLDDLGLAAAIESLAASAGRFHVELDLQACPLAPHMEICLYRVAQEALQNAVKHSGADRVLVTLLVEGERVVLSVVDNGRGFDPSVQRRPGSYGIGGMAERAALVGGTLEVVSSPGSGTEVKMSLPLSAAPGTEVAPG